MSEHWWAWMADANDGKNDVHACKICHTLTWTPIGATPSASADPECVSIDQEFLEMWLGHERKKAMKAMAK